MLRSCARAWILVLSLLFLQACTGNSLKPKAIKLSNLPYENAHLGQGICADHKTWVARVFGDRTYIGGEFYHIGNYTGEVAYFPAVKGEISSRPAKGYVAFESVRAVISDGAGGYFLSQADAGNTNSLESHLYKLDSKYQRVAGFDLRPDAIVWSMALSGKYLYLGGQFSNIDGQPRTRLARYDLEAQTLDSWAPVFDGHVFRVLLMGSDLVVVGAFNNINMGSGNLPRAKIAKFNATTGALSNWAPVVAGGDPNRLVKVDSDTVAISGAFTTVNGQPYARLALLNISDENNGTNLQGNAHSIDNVIYDIDSDGSYVYLSGSFRIIDSLLVGSLARLQVNGGGSTTNLDLAWQPKLNNYGVQSVKLHGSYVYAASASIGWGAWYERFVGDLTTVGEKGSGVETDNLIRFSRSNGALDPSWGVHFSTGAETLAAIGNTLFFFGRPNSVFAKKKVGIAAFDRASQILISDFTADAKGGQVLGFQEASSSHLYAYGLFTSVNGISRNGLVKINKISGQVDSSFVPNLTSTAGGNVEVRDLRKFGNTLIVVGRFTHVDGVAQNSLTLLDATTGARLATNINFSLTTAGARIYGVELDTTNNRIIIGGDFTSITETIGSVATARSYVAALEMPVSPATTWTLHAFDPGLSGFVYGVSQQGGALYVSGEFTAPRNRIAKFSLSTLAIDATFVPPTFSHWIKDAKLHNGYLHVGGRFINIGGVDHRRFARLDPSTGAVDASYKTFVQDYVYSFEMDPIYNRALLPGFMYGSSGNSCFNFVTANADNLVNIDSQLGR